MTYHVAVDIGASSGRLILASIQNNKLCLEEAHRFTNSFSKKNGQDVWNTDSLLTEILIGLSYIKSKGIERCTLGIDTWAVDYVLLSQNGNPLREAISYRDSRTNGIIDKVTSNITKESIYQKTGIQFQPFNSIYQLYTESANLLEQTKYILMIPDYLGYCLTGKAVTEFTNATTTQLVNWHTKEFDTDLLNIIGIKPEQFAPMAQPGDILGTILPKWYKQYDLPKCEVIVAATHDTASSVVGTPGMGSDWAFLSSGTWSLLGVENKNVIATKDAMMANYTNEGGAYETYRFLKNIMGLWLIQELKRNLNNDMTFADLVKEAEQYEPYKWFVDVSHQRFLNPPNMIEELQAYCGETNQSIPTTAGELTRCVIDNLAISYRLAMDQLEALTGKVFKQLIIGGGGSQNKLLNQLTADMIGKTVITGPSEATAVGNIVTHLITKNVISNIEEARILIKNSFESHTYLPSTTFDANNILKQYREVTSNGQTNSTTI